VSKVGSIRAFSFWIGRIECVVESPCIWGFEVIATQLVELDAALKSVLAVEDADKRRSAAGIQPIDYSGIVRRGRGSVALKTSGGNKMATVSELVGQRDQLKSIQAKADAALRKVEADIEAAKVAEADSAEKAIKDAAATLDGREGTTVGIFAARLRGQRGGPPE
jgi:hypothetical protein